MLSGAEVAFFSLTHKDVNLLKTKQHHSYKRIIDLLEHPKILLGSLLIANSLINISIIIISNILIDEFFTFNVAYLWIKFLIKVVVVTFIIVLFGEVIPKVMATQNNVRFAKEVGGVVEFVNYLFKRISGWLVKYSNVIEHRLTKKSSNAFTNEELFHAIEITDPGSNENEKNILKGILKFKDITVKQIMKTRLDVHGVDYDLKFDELIKHVEELHYSRLPVYKESLDEITGMIQTKDLLPFLEENKDFDWHTLIRSPYFVHEQKLIEDLLREFQSKHTHFAIVVDEFGGTSGIVTLEDILEEIIGDIKDEFDDEDSSYKKLDDHNYIFDGKTMINDVCRIMGLEDNTFETLKGESDSLAGLVLEIAGDIPKISQVITSGDFEFTVMEAEKNRIQKIKVTIKQPTSEA
jgi:gliding motility-associated protein GldE